MYYSDGISIQSYDVLTGYEEPLGLPSMNDFVLADNGKAKVLYTTVYNGYTSELAMYQFDASTGKWGDMVTLTDYDKYIRNYSVVLDASGNPSVALNLVTVNEEAEQIYGNSTLLVIDQSEYIDLLLTDNVTYEESLVEPNGRLPITFEVKNNSSQAIKQFTTSLLDESGNIISTQSVNCSLTAGGTAEAQIMYELPETMTYHKVTLQIKADGETNISNNSKEIAIGYADLAIRNLYISGKRSAAYLEGTIGNNGYTAAENVKANLYYGDNETAFETVELKTINAGSDAALKVAIPEEHMTVNPLVAGNIIRVEIVSDTEELKYDNNEKGFLILAEEEMKMALNATSLNMQNGDVTTLKITYCDGDILEENVTWTSSNDKAATVEDGRITAIGSGETMITASVNGMSATCVITVSDEVEVQSIFLDSSSINILVGASQRLTAQVLPVFAANKKFTWQSADTSVATVSADGTVSGVGVGETTITVTAEDGYHTSSCHVVVSQDENQTYSISFTGGDGTSGKKPETITGTAGAIVTLPVNPYSREGMLFAGWSDGESTYGEGSIYRIPYHNVVFTAQWNDDGIIKHTITATAGENGSITPSGETDVEQGTSQTFTITPDEGYEVEDVLVDDESIGTVTSYIFENVTEAHTIQVTFKEQDKDKIFVEEIVLSEAEASISVGETLVLSADVTPEDATDTALVWSSSDESIATVDNTGLVTALKSGDVIITAMAKDGSNVTAGCKITITKEKQKFAGAISYEKVYGDTAFSLETELAEGDGDVSYESSDKTVATVNASGKVTIKGAGTATITMTAGETSKYAETSVEIMIVVAKAAQHLDGTDSYTKAVGDADFLLGITQSEGDGMIRYTSSDNAVVTVNNTGKVSVVGAGTAEITVTAEETDDYNATNMTITITVMGEREEPGGTTEEPGGTTEEPGGTTEEPGGTTEESGGTTEEPGETTEEPGGTTEEPGGTTEEPGETTEEPGGTEQSGGTSTSGNVQDSGDTNQSSQVTVTPAGLTLIDAISKVTYRVIQSGIVSNGTVVGAEVEYMKPASRGSSVVIPDTVTIDGVQYKVTSIADNVFKNDKVLTKVKLGNNIITIGANAFSGCKKLKSITLGKNVDVIKNKAFYKCVALTKIRNCAKINLLFLTA